MRILVVGDGHSDIHEVAVANAFRKLGHVVDSFYWWTYFKADSPLASPWKKVQNKFLIGSSLNQINIDLVKIALDFKPSLIFIYRGTHIRPSTLLRLKQQIPQCQILGYNNDDPFAPDYSPWVWRHFLKCIPIYDVLFAYRHHNLIEFKKCGAKCTQLLRSWYIPETNKKVSLTIQEEIVYGCDVVFIGHHENDGRLECLEEIVEAGYKLKIYGPPHGWNKLLSKSEILKSFVPVKPLRGDDYNKAISGAKIALCFFSKLNRDTYTRRCFEIPATGTMLLSEYSHDLATLYKEGQECDFFRNQKDLVQKVKLYLNNDELRKRIASAGYNRVTRDGHDVVSRMIQVLKQVGYKQEVHTQK